MRNKAVLVTAILIQAFFFPSIASAFSVAIISDIHADKYKKIKNKETNKVIYPKNYKRCLKEIKNLNLDLVIVTGDIVNRGKKKYYKNLRNIMRGTQTFWVKGNHDKKSFKYLASDNYYADYENWRFIVLNTSEKFGSSTGYLENFQISQLSEWLNTDKNVAIAMHHPPFFYNSREGVYTSNKIQLYDDFFETLAPNVKYVFTGHWHFDQNVEIDGTTFLTQKALTQNNGCNYTVLEL